MTLKLVVVSAVLAGSLWGGNLFINPGFETSPIPADPGYKSLASGDDTSLANWTVTGGTCGSDCVLLLTAAYSEESYVGTLTFQPHSGNQSLDLTGSLDLPGGGIEQTVTVTPGGRYDLSFWVGKMDDRVGRYAGSSSIEVFVGGASQGVFSNDSSVDNQVAWEEFSLVFVAGNTSSVTIRFQNATGPGNGYAGLDDVSLEALPEPSTFRLLVFALGLSWLGAFRRYHK